MNISLDEVLLLFNQSEAATHESRCRKVQESGLSHWCAFRVGSRAVMEVGGCSLLGEHVPCGVCGFERGMVGWCRGWWRLGLQWGAELPHFFEEYGWEELVVNTLIGFEYGVHMWHRQTQGKLLRLSEG